MPIKSESNNGYEKIKAEISLKVISDIDYTL